MIVNKQKPVEFRNKCSAIFDEQVLKDAILALAKKYEKPTARLKDVFMHGKYPAISYQGQKIHIHRLLKCYELNKTFLWRDEYVHHKNGNKLDARLENLEVMKESEHQSHHNKGKIVSDETKRKHTENNKRLWNTRWKHRRIYENPELLPLLEV